MKLNLTPAGRPADINSMICTPIGKALWDQHDGRPAFLEGITIERTEILDTEGLIRDLLPPRYMNKIVYRIPATGPVVMGACLYDGTGYLYTVEVPMQPTHRMRVMCRDGFSVSVQASHYHYCDPKQDSGPYTQVELGYPSNRTNDEVHSYAEFCGTTDPTETVYPYVPADAVMRLLDEHGGMVGGQLPPLALDSPTIPLFSPTHCIHCGAEVWAENAGHHDNARCIQQPVGAVAAPDTVASLTKELLDMEEELGRMRGRVLDILWPLVADAHDPDWWRPQTAFGDAEQAVREVRQTVERNAFMFEGSNATPTQACCDKCGRPAFDDSNLCVACLYF